MAIPSFNFLNVKQEDAEIAFYLEQGLLQLELKRGTDLVPLDERWRTPPAKPRRFPTRRLGPGETVSRPFSLTRAWHPSFYALSEPGEYTLTVTLDTTAVADEADPAGPIRFRPQHVPAGAGGCVPRAGRGRIAGGLRGGQGGLPPPADRGTPRRVLRQCGPHPAYGSGCPGPDPVARRTGPASGRPGSDDPPADPSPPGRSGCAAAAEFPGGVVGLVAGSRRKALAPGPLVAIRQPLSVA